MSCVPRRRTNARSIRGTINSEMWRELNKLYWQLCDPEFVRRAGESPHEFYQAVECGSHLFQGVCDATADPRRGLAVHPAGQVPGARRQDPAHPRHPVSPAARADRPGRPAAVQPALGGGPAQLPGVRGVPAAVRRPRRAGARRRVSAAAPGLPALGALLPGSGGRGAGGDRGTGARPRAEQGRPRAGPGAQRAAVTASWTRSSTGDLHAFLGGVWSSCVPGQPGRAGAVFAAVSVVRSERS